MTTTLRDRKEIDAWLQQAGGLYISDLRITRIGQNAVEGGFGVCVSLDGWGRGGPRVVLEFAGCQSVRTSLEGDGLDLLLESAALDNEGEYVVFRDLHSNTIHIKAKQVSARVEGLDA